MAQNTIEVLGPGGTVEIVSPVQPQVIEVDAGGRAGPRGPDGPAGPQGNQGPQGRFNLQIFRRDTVMPTEAPVGGSFNIDTGVLTAPDGWGTNPNIPGDGDLYQARATIDPRTESGTVTPSWSVPFEAGGTGPPGLPGDSVEVFYANDAQGNGATTAYNNQPFIAFVLYFSGTNPPVTPPAGTVWLEFVGPAGAPGEDVLIFYADDGAGTNATTVYSAQEFIAFVLFDTDTTPPENPPPGTVFSRFVGAPGTQVIANPAGTPTATLDTVQIDQVIYQIAGGPAPHAQIVPEFSIVPTSITLPIIGTRTLTATATAMIRDAAVGDTVNTVEIQSAHSSLLNDNITIRNPDPLTDTTTFTWTVGTSVTEAVDVEFTCVFTVNYTIDGDTLQHSFTRTATLRIVAPPVPFWTGTLTDAQIADLTALSDAEITAALTERSNFSSPYTLAYTGAAAPTNLHAALYVNENFNITSAVSEGFVLDIESQNEPAASRTLYVTRFPLTDGTHNVTWRTS